MAYVLAGGRGSRLMELTDRRAKPAVYFGGKSRIIDFALSNALNSGIRRIAVATQYKAHSLIRHLQRGWNFFRPERNESFDILPASQRVSETMWYLGTADAVYQNIDIIESYAPQYMVILAGDHIYKMDYEKMLQQHVESGADVTVGCLEASLEEAKGLRRDARRRQRPHPLLPRKAQESAADAGQAGRRAVQHGHLCLRHQIPDRGAAGATPPIRIPPMISARTSSPTSSRTAKRSRIISRVLRRLQRGGADLLARRRDGRRLLGRQYRPDRHRARPRSLRPRLADLDLWRDHAAGASSSTTWTAGAASRSPRWSRAAASSPARRSRARCCSPAGASIPIRRSTRRSSCPMSAIGRNVRLRKVVIDAEVQIPDGLVVGEDPELDAKRFRRTENGVTLITQPMIDKLGS